MQAVATSVDSSTGGVKVVWLAPADGSDPITNYKIEVKTASDTWVAETANCGGSPATSCIIPMSTLTEAPYSLPFDRLVEVRASASNSYGWGPPSPVNSAGARVRRAPDQMAPPVVTAVTEAQISLQWTALTAPGDGNSAVLAYNAYWDNGSGTTNIALLDGLATTAVVPGLTGGTTYRFKVRARNIYGNGAFSTELAVLASDLPDKVAIPTVAVAAASVDVTVTWDAPGDHAAPLDAYEVLLRKADGSFVDGSSSCNSGAGPSLAGASCAIPMTTVSSLTGLAVGAVIQAKVRAHNANGWGAHSELNTAGALVESAPTQISAPPVLVVASSTAT
jgi:hypothetical protein